MHEDVKPALNLPILDIYRVRGLFFDFNFCHCSLERNYLMRKSNVNINNRTFKVEVNAVSNFSLLLLLLWGFTAAGIQFVALLPPTVLNSLYTIFSCPDPFLLKKN